MSQAGDEIPKCCGLPVVHTPTHDSMAFAGSPAAIKWNGMLDWYSKFMSPATCVLKLDVAGKLGLLGGSKHSTLNVLETHCGDAVGTEKMLSNESRIQSYTLCDFSSAMLDGARKNLENANPSITPKFVLADSCDLPFPDHAFDRYLSNMGCCCVADIDAKLKEASRVLKPGGTAGCSMRCETDEDIGFKAIAKALQPFGFPQPTLREGLVIGTDHEKLKAKLAACGFKSDSIAIWQDYVTINFSSEQDYVEFARGPMTAQWWEQTFGPGAPGDEEDKKAKEAEAIKAIQSCANRALGSGGAKVPIAAFIAEAA